MLLWTVRRMRESSTIPFGFTEAAKLSSWDLLQKLVSFNGQRSIIWFEPGALVDRWLRSSSLTGHFVLFGLTSPVQSFIICLQAQSCHCYFPASAPNSFFYVHTLTPQILCASHAVVFYFLCLTKCLVFMFARVLAFTIAFSHYSMSVHLSVMINNINSFPGTSLVCVTLDYWQWLRITVIRPVIFLLSCSNSDLKSTV